MRSHVSYLSHVSHNAPVPFVPSVPYSLRPRSKSAGNRGDQNTAGVSAATPPVIKARASVYRASSARPAILRGLLAVLRRSRVPIFSSISILSIWGFSLNLSSLSILFTQNTHLSSLFHHKIAKMKIFLSTAFCAFGGGFCPFCSSLLISNNFLLINILY